MVVESKEVIAEVINKLNNTTQIFLTDNNNFNTAADEELQEIIKRHYEDKLYNLNRKEK